MINGKRSITCSAQEKMMRIATLLALTCVALSPLLAAADSRDEGGTKGVDTQFSESAWVARIAAAEPKHLRDTLVYLQNALIDRPKAEYPLLENQIQPYLKAEQEALFQTACRALALVGSRNSLSIINGLLKTSPLDRQYMLVWVLDELRFGDSVPVLLGLLESKDIDLKKRVLLALGEIKSTKTVEPMIKIATTDRSGTLRGYAIEALAEIPDDRTIQPLIDLMKQWPVTLDEEPVVEFHDPRAYYQQYMVPSVIDPALRRLTNHEFTDHASWVKWWNAHKHKGLETVYLAGFTGYSVQFDEASIPIFIQILEDDSLPRFKRENAQITLARLLRWDHWDKSDFKPKKWAAEWRRVIKATGKAERATPADAETHH
jgi:hypothetical protein